MDTLKIGQIITGEQNRDAIHIAVAPVEAGEPMLPGARVIINNGLAFEALTESVGVVDPFLRKAVHQGQRFWLFLNPGSITSLRHEWTHPELPSALAPVAPATISQSEHVTKSLNWIRGHAKTLDITENFLMHSAKIWLEHERHQVQQGGEQWRDCFNPTEFWHHYEIVTGEVVDADKKGSFFCCSC